MKENKESEISEGELYIEEIKEFAKVKIEALQTLAKRRREEIKELSEKIKMAEEFRDKLINDARLKGK